MRSVELGKRGGRGRGMTVPSCRKDNKSFAVLSEPDDNARDGDGSEMDTDIHENMFLDMTGGFSNAENDLCE